MTQYSRGANYERRVKKELEEDGWPLVVRAAGSKGPVDLVAICGDASLLVQCKTRKPTAAERRAAEEASRRIGKHILLKWPGGEERATGAVSRRTTRRDSAAQPLPGGADEDAATGSR